MKDDQRWEPPEEARARRKEYLRFVWQMGGFFAFSLLLLTVAMCASGGK